MSQILFAAATWLHNLASVVFIGHFTLMALIYLPALDTFPQDVRGPVLSCIVKHSRHWMYASLLVFAITGSYLTVVDPNYLGLGTFRSAWTWLMLVKHVLIVVMIALGFLFNAVLRVGTQAASRTGGLQAVARLRGFVYAMAGSGAAVLLLTAISQAQ